MPDSDIEQRITALEEKNRNRSLWIDKAPAWISALSFILLTCILIHVSLGQSEILEEQIIPNRLSYALNASKALDEQNQDLRRIMSMLDSLKIPIQNKEELSAVIDDLSFHSIQWRPLPKIERSKDLYSPIKYFTSPSRGLLFKKLLEHGFNPEELNEILSQVTLKGADFSNLIISQPPLLYCNLDISESYFLQSRWKNAKTPNMMATESHIENSKFHFVNFVGADFSGSVLKDVFINDSDLSGADFSNCKIDNVICQDCQHSGLIQTNSQGKILFKIGLEIEDPLEHSPFTWLKKKLPYKPI